MEQPLDRDAIQKRTRAQLEYAEPCQHARDAAALLDLLGQSERERNDLDNENSDLLKRSVDELVSIQILQRERDAARRERDEWEDSARKMAEQIARLIGERHNLKRERDVLAGYLASVAQQSYMKLLRAAEARVLRLETALEKYGVHKEGCTMMAVTRFDGVCRCGLGEVLAAVPVVPDPPLSEQPTRWP